MKIVPGRVQGRDLVTDLATRLARPALLERVLSAIVALLVLAPTLAAASLATTSGLVCDGRWHKVPSPTLRRESKLNGVATLSSSSAWAVGSTIRSGADRALIERWNGSGWAVVPIPEPPGTSVLEAVAASSESDVWAVGYSNAGELAGLIEHFDGDHWSIVSVPKGTGIVASGIAVASPTDVWVVGRRYLLADPRQRKAALTMHFDGTSWHITRNNTRTMGEVNLAAVTIVSPSDVWAVGYRSSRHEIYETLAVRWDGVSWDRAPTPHLGDSQFTGVTAPASGPPVAVGVVLGDPLSEVWDGSSWAAQPVPGTSSFDTLTSVSNGGGVNTWAVGWEARPNDVGTRALFERWDGSSWASALLPKDGVNDLFNGVSGAGGSFWAVGWTRDEYGGPVRMLIAGRCVAPVTGTSAERHDGR